MPQSVQTPDSRILWPPQHSPATSKVFAQNTIEIAASPDTIWTLLIDCVRWPSWYKHCSDVSILRGGAAPKRKIEISIQDARILLRTGN
jgi:hypothetical protein